ncbi:hypothetical protein [uncultured Dokdonia sp.]|uniref:hypothetical protein n=1 Tax=uncultured Dokdonia sp. TaxID=575653 RepID=UPI0026387D31|nr:hypothetical protein [uncultured Dokdonia sp.]
MQHLQHTLIALVFLITGTTYSQVALAPSAPNSSENYKVTAAYQGVYIPNVSIKNITDAPAVVQKDARIPSMLVFNKTTSKQLKSGYYFWNGKQWEVYDTSIVAPDTGLAVTDTKAPVLAPSSTIATSEESAVSLR